MSPVTQIAYGIGRAFQPDHRTLALFIPGPLLHYGYQGVRSLMPTSAALFPGDLASAVPV